MIVFPHIISINLLIAASQLVATREDQTPPRIDWLIDKPIGWLIDCISAHFQFVDCCKSARGFKGRPNNASKERNLFNNIQITIIIVLMIIIEDASFTHHHHHHAWWSSGSWLLTFDWSFIHSLDDDHHHNYWMLIDYSFIQSLMIIIIIILPCPIFFTPFLSLAFIIFCFTAIIEL